MGSNRRLSRVSCLLAVVCAAGIALIGPVPASADPRDDAKTAGTAADRAEAILEDATVVARNAARRLEAATAALPAAQQKVASSRGVVAAARAEAITARRKAKAARAAYDKVAARFEEAQSQVEQARDRVDEIASASYMGANLAAINVLAGATGPQDAMDRLGLVDQVMQKQQDSVAEMSTARRAARTEQDRAGLAKRAAEDAEQDAVGKLAIARSAQVAAVKARTAVVDLANSRQEALALARSQRSAVLAEYRRAKAEEARVVAALQAWEAKQGGSVTSSLRAGGKLLMPVHGWKSSDFGQRYDPYYRVWQLHAGTDIAADGGTPDPRGGGRASDPGRLERRVRQLHLHQPRQAAGSRLLHVLRPPIDDRRPRR